MRNKAVCIRCGTLKKKPFSRCSSCSYEGGNTYEDRAKSYMLSEDYLLKTKKSAKTIELLADYAKKIQSNEPINFNDAEVYRLVHEQETLEDIPRFQSVKIILFCSLFFVIPAIAVVAWLFL